MAAAEAGIVAPIMNQPGQQQQTIQQPPMNPKLNAQLEQQLQDQFRPEDFLPITTQNQSISQMITTYAANEMVSFRSFSLCLWSEFLFVSLVRKE